MAEVLKEDSMFESFTKGGVSNKYNSSIIHLPKIFDRESYKNVGFVNDEPFFCLGLKDGCLQTKIKIYKRKEY